MLFLVDLRVNLVPRGRAPFVQRQESRPLARSNDLVLNGFENTIDWDQNQSDLSDVTLSMRRVTGSPWIADFRCWTRPEVAILGADQKERGLWGRECLRVSFCFGHARERQRCENKAVRTVTWRGAYSWSSRLWSLNMNLLSGAARNSNWKSPVVFIGFAKRRYEITFPAFHFSAYEQ